MVRLDGVRTYVPAAWTVHPVGATVWLPREGRRGRVVVRTHGGLLYRVRLEDDGESRLLERPGCELSPVDEGCRSAERGAAQPPATAR